MLNLSNPTQRRWGNPPSWLYKNDPSYALLQMTSIFLEKDSDTIYDEFQDTTEDNQDEEYREDRMDQMISKYGWLEVLWFKT